MLPKYSALFVLGTSLLIIPACVEDESSHAQHNEGVDDYIHISTLTVVAPVEFRDSKGILWRLRGPAQFAPKTQDGIKSPKEPTAIGPSDTEITTWTNDDW